MAYLEPGERFTVNYGNGHTIEVVALSGRQKRKVMSLVEEVSQIQAVTKSKTRLFDIAEEAFLLCCPDASDELMDRLDERLQLEIVGQTLQGATLSDDDKKKSASQP